MEKREKIIVVLAIVVAMYGAIDFLVLSKKDSALIATQKNNNAIITAAKTKLTSQAVGGQVQNLIQRINAPWPKGIFFNRPHESIRGDGDNSEDKEAILEQFNPSNFIYSGYLEMGGEKIAIINGTDYKLNNEIKGFRLTEISPDKIQVTLRGESFDIDIQPEQEAGMITEQQEGNEIKTRQE